MAHAAGLDRLWFDHDALVLTGWTAGGGRIELRDADGAPVPPDAAHDVSRADVAAVHPCEAPPRGRLQIWHGPVPAGAVIATVLPGGREKLQPLTAFAPDAREIGLDRLLLEYPAATGLFFDMALGFADRDPGLLATVAAGAKPVVKPGSPRGHLEAARIVPGIGGLMLGWCIGARACFHLVDERGHHQAVSGAAQHWNRPDIFQAFSDEHGADCAEAGFLVAWRQPTALGESIRLLARAGPDLLLINACVAEAAPLDAVSYARWAFSLPVPPERMIERFRTQDGAILQALVERACAKPDGRAPLRRQAGPPVVDPVVSILVPLYARADFIDHQLLEFADDPFIRERCELIYIVDDPALVQPVQDRLERWWQLHALPITMLWGGRNRGYSGANNLGLAAARGRQVLFLNSDVIPQAPGWLGTLSARLDDNPAFALLGARLLYPGSGLQHDGMVFEFDPHYGAWLNQHPGKGLAPKPASAGAILPCPAATGACLIGQRQELLAAGGFSENYLIGDFEDSDLCLKLTRTGRRIGTCPDVVLTHLERQSFGLWGSDDFRMKVMLFNAWQHQERWRDMLEASTMQIAGTPA